MAKLGKYIKPYVLYMILTMVIKFGATICELQIPNLMQIMVDEKVPAGQKTQIYLYGLYMVIFAALALIGNILANRMTARSSGKITKKIRHDLFEKLENLSARQMDKLTVSSAESRLTSDTYNVNQLLARVQRMGIRAPILLVGGMVMMMRMDMVLSLVLLSLLPIIALVVYFVTKYSVPLYTKQQTALDKVVRVLQENITGIRVIKALSKTEYEKGRFNDVNSDLSRTGQQAATVSSITNPVVTLTLRIGLTLVVIIGAYRVNDGAFDGGVILAFLTYFTMILNAMLGVTRIFVMWSKGQASANRVADVLALEPDLQALPDSLEEKSDAPHIEFEDVTFSYTGVGTNIENLSFTLERGQTLGILGATGSGKSTIINLLLRLYDPDQGRIYIDGQDIRTMDYKLLRKKFGVVFQNDFITEGSIRDNITFFRELSEDAVQRSAVAAQAGFIREKGMDGEVAVRGNNLSGGQKQRLLIARALAADPEILILDDASSALDYQTDSELRQALRKDYRNTTTVVVAQRISSLMHADLILVLNEGQVIGSGDHAHLIETCEEYRMIAQTQMGDGKEAL